MACASPESLPGLSPLDESRGRNRTYIALRRRIFECSPNGIRELPAEESHLDLVVQSHASYYWTNRH